MGERIRLIPVTFADNATESGAVDLLDKLTADEAVVGVEVPAGFVGTGITFLNSLDKTNYRDVLQTDGTPYALVVAADSYVQMDPVATKGFSSIKLVADSQTGGPLTLNLVASRVT